MKGRTQASTREQALTAKHVPSAQVLTSTPSSPAGLADPSSGPFDFLTPFCDVIPGVSSDPIRTRATVDGVLAPIHRKDMIVATPPASSVRAIAKAQRVVAVPSTDAISATEAVDGVIIRGTCKGVRSIIALDGSRREACIVALGDPVYGEELPSGVQPSALHLKRPHQAVLALVRRAPVGVEPSAKRIGGYTLSSPALILGILVPQAAAAIVVRLVSDFQEVPADYQLLAHHHHRLHRTHGVAHPTALAACSLV